MRQDEYPCTRWLDNHKAVEWAIATTQLGFPETNRREADGEKWRAAQVMPTEAFACRTSLQIIAQSSVDDLRSRWVTPSHRGAGEPLRGDNTCAAPQARNRRTHVVHFAQGPLPVAAGFAAARSGVVLTSLSCRGATHAATSPHGRGPISREGPINDDAYPAIPRLNAPRRGTRGTVRARGHRCDAAEPARHGDVFDGACGGGR